MSVMLCPYIFFVLLKQFAMCLGVVAVECYGCV